MKKALLAIVGLLVAAGGGLYVFIARPLLAPAQDTPIAETALATPDVVLLAGMNVKQAVFLERWFLGTPVVQAAHVRSAPSAPERTLLDHLRAANVDARRDIDYVLYALYPADGTWLRHAIVLIGRFDPRPLNQYLAHDLGGIPHTEAGHVSYDVARTDPTNCRADTTWTVTVDPSWILLADSESHAALLTRLTGMPRDTAGELAWWRPLARTDVLSLGAWNLKRLESGAAHPLWKGMSTALSTEADGLQRLYLGVGVRTLPLQGRLRIVVDALDGSRAAQKIRGWREAVDRSRAGWANAMPTAAALYDSLKIRSEGDRSTIEFTADRTLAANLQRVVNELLGAMLGGLGVRSTVPAAAPPAERIDTTPLTFEASASAGGLTPYDPSAQFAEEVDRIKGPFGLRMGAIRLGSEPDVGLELVVEGFANAIPNLPGDGGRARLFVESVKSAAGKELLRPEDCGRERNNQPAVFTASFSRRLKAAKTLRLIAGTDPRTLQSVSGRVELRLPTRTETVSVLHPAPGAVLEKNGSRFTITEAKAGSVSYQITGARDDVLDFRALNGKGQPLASQSGFSADFLLGEGVSGQKNYAGVVDRVEVVFATAEQTVTFPFTLDDFSLAGQSGKAALDTAEAFRPYSYQAMRREHWKPLPPVGTHQAAATVVQLEPFELSLDKVQALFGLRLDLRLRSPVLPNFEKAFTVGQLRLTRIRLKDGTVLEPPAGQGADSQPPTRSTWEAAIRFGTTPKDGVLTAPLYLAIDAKAKPEALERLDGVLAVQFPKALQTLRLDDLSPGRSARLGDLTVTVTARGRKSVTLQTNKDGHRLLYVRLTNSEGQALAFFGPQITESPDGAWRFELSPLGTPVRAEVILADALDRKAYPFVLTAK